MIVGYMLIIYVYTGNKQALARIIVDLRGSPDE